MTQKVPYYVKEIRKGQAEVLPNALQPCARLMIAGVGNTQAAEHVAMGLLAIWEEQGLKPRGFSAGPSYRNLEALRLASGREAYTLDSWFHEEEDLSYLLTRYTEGHKAAVIAADEAYFDTYSPLTPAWSEERMLPRGSAAELARLTKTPVIMVVDAERFCFTHVAYLRGLLQFRPDEKIAGFVLTGVSKDRIEEIRRQVEAELGLPVYGYLAANLLDMQFPSIAELVPAVYAEIVRKNLQILKEELRMSLDTVALYQLAGRAEALDPGLPQQLFKAQRFLGFENRRCRVAVARDLAFSYYYRENLDLLAEMGLDPVFFSPLRDAYLPPDIDGIYLGTGELLNYLAEASNNEQMRHHILHLAQEGVPILAEGSGAVYLSRGFKTETGREWPLVGILPTLTMDNPEKQTLYYGKMTARREDLAAEQGMSIRCLLGNRFRFQPEGASYRTSISGAGFVMEGFSAATIWASQAQVHFYAQPMLAARFAAACQGRLSGRVQPREGLKGGR